MAVIFVILAGVAFIVIDYFMNHRRSEQTVDLEHSGDSVEFEKTDGIQFSPQLYFHPFHSWLKPLDAQTAKVGLDDFARRLSGHADRLLLPEPGTVVEAGLPCIGIGNGGRITRIVTPVAGEITEINPALKDKPELIFDDPYGEGWVFKIKDWRLQDQKKSLLTGQLIADWMRGAVQRMRYGINGIPAIFAQDGGMLCEDICAELDRFEWSKLVKENLGTESYEMP